jgi:hypothetical protein
MAPQNLPGAPKYIPKSFKMHAKWIPNPSKWCSRAPPGPGSQKVWKIMKNGKVRIIELGQFFAPKSKKNDVQNHQKSRSEKNVVFDVKGLPNGTKTPPKINAKNV